MENRIETARQRLAQLFNFFKAVEQRRSTIVLDIADQPWVLWLSALPEHETLQLIKPIEGDGAWLKFKKPNTHPCPDPGDRLRQWLETGWAHPDVLEVGYKAERVEFNGDNRPIQIRFESQPGLNQEYLVWKESRALWLNEERPARAALRVWERFFALHSQLEREGEAWELVLGEGIFNWKRPTGGLMNHPLLLQRVELSFDPFAREFRVSNIDMPPELYSALFSDDECAGLPVKRWQEELCQGEIYPLGDEIVTDWLKGIVGTFRDGELVEGAPVSAKAFPRIGRAPVLFLRKRDAGYTQFIDKILDDLPTATELPSSLVSIVGCAPERKPNESNGETSSAYANEDEDTLLSKPANAEQIAILKRLARQEGVLVQGPPGTGKTHTIANLIGSLLAEGKNVLVTSHTTKALRVLRDQVSEPLRSLCVSLLDSDVASRKELEMAGREIAVRLCDDRQSYLQKSNDLTGKRRQILAELRAARADLSMAVNGEYRSLILAGEEIEPAKAAREVAVGVGLHDWIPGSVSKGDPLPLVESELKALYLSNQQLTSADEDDLSRPLPRMSEVWTPDEFSKYVRELDGLTVSDRDYRKELWEQRRSDGDELELLLEQVTHAVEYFCQTETDAWRLAVIQAGMEGGQTAEIWRMLCREIEAVREQASKTAESLFRYTPQLVNECALEEQRDVLREIVQHFSQENNLSFATLLFRPKWKKLIERWRIDGGKPTRREHFYALLSMTELELARGKLLGYWERQMQLYGAPDLKQLPNLNPEEFAFQFVPQINHALQWHKYAWTPLEQDLVGQGLRWGVLLNEAPPLKTPHHRAERLRYVVREMLPEIMATELRRRRYSKLKEEFDGLAARLKSIDSPARVTCDLMRAIEQKAADAYRLAYLRLEQLHQLLPVYQERMAWLKRLRVTAPDWADAVARRFSPHDNATIPGMTLPAWRWRQFTQELDHRAALSVPEIQTRIERLGDELREVTVNLIEQRAWAALLARVTEEQRLALLAWLAIMKKIGAGTGKNVDALKREAGRLMKDARKAVPVWIMPFNQIPHQFSNSVCEPFDVLIVDEASQEGVLGLIPFYMAKKVIVVGDDEQVTPLDVGGEQQPIFDLIGQWLKGLPGDVLFDLKTSVYDRAKIAFGSAIRLKEHFRCVPEIIQFSNHLSYGGEIKPLRESASTEIKPALVAYRVDGNKLGKKNLVEAEKIASLIAAAIEQPEYEGKTFGVISLMGNEQADEIDKMLRTRLDPVIYETRRLLCGNPAQFQGDERDVIFLSMVDSKEDGDGPLGLRQDGADGMWKKRYNVAASRARDQLWVVYSLDHQTQLKPGDLRRRLIEHAINPNALMSSLAEGVAKTESPFEAEVCRLLIGQGYQVHSQWQVGAYRIDLVVEGNGKRLAVECDGERWHYDKVEEDLARQALLERLGWKFVRIRGSVFYRDKTPNRENALRPLFERLQQIGITPVESVVATVNDEVKEGEDALQRIKQRASALLHEWNQAHAGNNGDGYFTQGIDASL